MRLAAVLLSCWALGARASAGPVVEGPESARSLPQLPVAPGLAPQAGAFAPQASLPEIKFAAELPSAPNLAKPDAPASPATQATVSLAEPSFAFDGWRHGLERASLTLQRAAVLPAHIWPLTALTKAISHGEGLAGLTPTGAVEAAKEVKKLRGTPTVVGRLSWELHDAWSVKGAARSYARLIDELAAAKKADPALDVAVSLDIEALGAQLTGLSDLERARIARAHVFALAKRAHAAGIPIELDIGSSALLPTLSAVARSVVLELGVPVRLALAARYLASEEVLRNWAALARETRLTLGVRLVKGSFIEADKPSTLFTRRELIAQYKRLITLALAEGDALDVAVATHNSEIIAHAREQAALSGAPVSFQAIRGVEAPMQAALRQVGAAPREYVSYGVDTPVMAIMEWWTNWKQRRALRRRGVSGID